MLVHVGWPSIFLPRGTSHPHRYCLSAQLHVSWQVCKTLTKLLWTCVVLKLNIIFLNHSLSVQLVKLTVGFLLSFLQ